MEKSLRKTSEKYGLPPGTIVHTGERKTDRVRITVFDYNEQTVTEREVGTIEECIPFRDSPTITWINIDGIQDVGIIEKIGKEFNLHPLLLEDVVHTEQRPKIDDYEQNLFVVVRQFFYDSEEREITAEQVSFVLGHNFVITFQEREGDVFNPIRDRLRTGKGRVRKSGSDYLLYSLLDTLVDSYFILIEEISDDIENMEPDIMESNDPDTIYRIHRQKRNLIHLRKSLWPLREVISGLKSSTTHLINRSTDVYLRDVYDHTIQVVETLELLRDMIAGLIDLNLSSASNRLNEVMKVLTLISTVFIPLTFIAGIYGMNFQYMPELGMKWGYFGALGLMVVIGIIMVIYFKSRKWL